MNRKAKAIIQRERALAHQKAWDHIQKLVSKNRNRRRKARKAEKNVR